MAKTCGGIFRVLCRRTWFREENWGRKAGFLFLEGDAGLYIMGNAGRSNRVIIYIYARQTYPQFVAKFGGRATHYKNIRKNGIGYYSNSVNFQTLLKHFGIRQSVAAKKIGKMLEDTFYDDF